MVLSKTINCSTIQMFTTKPMNPYIVEQQIDELSNFDVIESLNEDPSLRWNDIDFDDESNNFEILLSSPNDF